MSSEHVVQTSIVNWTRDNHPEITIFAIPNGGYRTGKNAKMLKDEGVLDGIPDLQLLYKSNTLFMEVKTTIGERTENQVKRHKEIRNQGFTVVTAYGYEQAISVIKNWVKDINKEE